MTTALDTHTATISRTGMARLARRRTQKLSGGESQRVRFALALVLTTFGRPGYLRRAMEAGALGFVVKDAPAEQLANAVRRVAAGSGSSTPTSPRPRPPGATVADIARRLFLSEGTVRNYLSAAIAKTGVRNRVEAVRVADERGWL
jgi:two-component system, NarL family, response regulator DesR